MGNIQCSKCALDALSKCPKCRTVFIEKPKHEQTLREKNCDHEWHYKQSKLKCIYGCNYVSPFVYGG